jgi:hypothetical protein
VKALNSWIDSILITSGVSSNALNHIYLTNIGSFCYCTHSKVLLGHEGRCSFFGGPLATVFDNFGNCMPEASLLHILLELTLQIVMYA